MVNLLDRDAWLAEAGEVNLGPGKVYLLGDATLDGNVDGNDFIAWNAHKFTNVAEWCSETGLPTVSSMVRTLSSGIPISSPRPRCEHCRVNQQLEINFRAQKY